MHKILIIVLALFITNVAFAQDEKPEVINIGDVAPTFKVTTLNGKTIDTKTLKGKVIYLNFFATWCRPCIKEIPHVEADIWKTIKHDDFVMVAIGREHSMEEMKTFRKKKSLTLPISADPKREIYSQFAPQMIPRNIVIDKTGKVVYSKHGFTEEEFKGMIELIKKELSK